MVTPEGLQYKVLKPTLGCSIKPDSNVTVEYELRLGKNNQVIDSSYSRGIPATFPIFRVIEAWRIGIPLMRVGEV